MIVMAGQMNFAKLADDFPVFADQNGTVVVTLLALVCCQLGIPQVKADFMPGRLVKERLNFFAWLPNKPMRKPIRKSSRKLCQCWQLIRRQKPVSC